MTPARPPSSRPLIQSVAMDTAEEMQQAEQTKSIQLSIAAAEKVKELLQQEGQPDVVLRVAVQPGGCSGLRYQMFLDDNLAETDVLSEQHGVRVAVDRMSAPYLTEAKVDFVDTLEASGFTIDNPAAQSSCACGNSFH